MPLPKLKSDFLQHVDNSDDVVGILVPGTRKVKCSFANMILPLGNYCLQRNQLYHENDYA